MEEIDPSSHPLPPNPRGTGGYNLTPPLSSLQAPPPTQIYKQHLSSSQGNHSFLVFIKRITAAGAQLHHLSGRWKHNSSLSDKSPLTSEPLEQAASAARARMPLITTAELPVINART